MIITLDSIFAFGYPKGYELYDFEPYTHELIYFKSGEGSTKINGLSFDYYPNTVCFTAKGDMRDHFCHVTTEYICIRFTSLKTLLIESGVYHCESNELIDLFKKVHKEVVKKHHNYHQICNLTICEILYRLDRIKMVASLDTGFYQLIQEIDETLFFKKTVQEMAIEVGYSYDHFRHKFKEITGVAPLQYIINKRIEHACYLLQHEALTCTEIAQVCGFSSSPQFSKLFKRVMGITPNDYKKMNQ